MKTKMKSKNRRPVARAPGRKATVKDIEKVAAVAFETVKQMQTDTARYAARFDDALKAAKAATDTVTQKALDDAKRSHEAAVAKAAEKQVKIDALGAALSAVQADRTVDAAALVKALGFDFFSPRDVLDLRSFYERANGVPEALEIAMVRELAVYRRAEAMMRAQKDRDASTHNWLWPLVAGMGTLGASYAAMKKSKTP